MTLIVETGAGLSDAEAYASAVDFRAYHAARGLGARLDSFETEDVEPALRRATEYLSVIYGPRLAGCRVYAGQALDWPRATVPRARSLVGGTYYYPTNVVPTEVARATCELALRVLDGVTLMPDQVGGAPVRERTVGPITMVYDTGVAVVAPRYEMVDALMRPFLIVGGSLMKVVRA